MSRPSVSPAYAAALADPNLDFTRILETFAASQPAAPAMHAPGRPSLTYANLGLQIRYVRERLGTWDIARGDVIAGVVPARPEMVIACASVPAGATFAPLGPNLGIPVYEEVLSRLRPKAVMVERGLDHPFRALAQRHGLAEIELASDPGMPAGMFTLDLVRKSQSLRPHAPLSPDIAVIISTSGTTGKQKMVPFEQRRLTLSALASADWWKLSPGDVVCHLAPTHLLQGILSAAAVPLVKGSSLVCLQESSIDGFFAALGPYRPTWATATFTHYKEILKRIPDWRDSVRSSRLRFFRLGAGALRSEEIDGIEQAFGAPVLATFSATESPGMTANPLPPRIRKRDSVGVPVASEVAVLNDAGGFCSAGEAGEIVARGPLVMSGYVDDPHATAAAFFGNWFRTGDLGRFDEEGYLYVVGRIKDLINRGGVKISPVELDAAIEGLSGVREAATFAIPHPTLGEEVVAAVVREPGAEISDTDIVDQVHRRLGPKRAPRRVWFVDKLPRTDLGKVRRAELPRLLGLDQSAVASPNESPAPKSSPLEAALLGLWSSVLQVKSMGVNDDFSLLGGDPQRGARLLVSVRAVFGVDLPIECLFRNAATVASMARAIEAARSVNASVDHG